MYNSAFGFNESAFIGLRKPQLSHAITLDSSKPLTRSLLSLLLFEQCANGGLGSGMRDYANPVQTFTYSGTSQKSVASPFGGLSCQTDGATNDRIVYAKPLASTNVWSFSFFFNATVPTSVNPWSVDFSSDFGPVFDLASLSGDTAIVANVGLTSGIAVTSGNGDFTDFNSVAFLTPPITGYHTWARLTFTSDGTTTKLYVNGSFQSSAALAGTTFALGAILVGWPFPTSDLFWWSRTLSAQEVLAHSSDPYGSTLKVLAPVRPRVRAQLVNTPSQNLGPMLAS